jgi:hypothetical protein
MLYFDYDQQNNYLLMKRNNIGNNLVTFSISPIIIYFHFYIQDILVTNLLIKNGYKSIVDINSNLILFN